MLECTQLLPAVICIIDSRVSLYYLCLHDKLLSVAQVLHGTHPFRILFFIYFHHAHSDLPEEDESTSEAEREVNIQPETKVIYCNNTDLVTD